jgi:hypothetical protein
MLGRMRIWIARAFPIEAFVLSRFLIYRGLNAVGFGRRLRGSGVQGLLAVGIEVTEERTAADCLQRGG